MRSGRIIAGLTLSAIIVGSAFAAPAIDAQETGRRSLARSFDSISIASFTPASADSALAGDLARSAVSLGKFRFTPAESTSVNESRSIIVTANLDKRIHGDSIGHGNTGVAMSPSLSIAPIEYNLRTADTAKSAARPHAVTSIDLGASPLGQESFDLGAAYKGKAANKAKSTTSVVPARAAERAAALAANNPDDMIDVGGSYSLTRNFDLTAGVRYKTERERLPQLQDNRRDSQSVYIGTAFRF